MWPKHPSKKFLIENCSKARVLVASGKRYVTKRHPLTGAPVEFSRPLMDSDVRASLARKFG